MDPLVSTAQYVTKINYFSSEEVEDKLIDNEPWLMA